MHRVRSSAVVSENQQAQKHISDNALANGKDQVSFWQAKWRQHLADKTKNTVDVNLVRRTGDDRLESQGDAEQTLLGNLVEAIAEETAAHHLPGSGRQQHSKTHGRPLEETVDANEDDIEEDVPDDNEQVQHSKIVTNGLRPRRPRDPVSGAIAAAAIYDEGDDLADEPADDRAVHSKGELQFTNHN